MTVQRAQCKHQITKVSCVYGYGCGFRCVCVCLAAPRNTHIFVVLYDSTVERYRIHWTMLHVCVLMWSMLYSEVNTLLDKVLA